MEELIQVKKVGRPRKYETTEEAREAKLLKDKLNYEKKNPNVEHGKVGRKPTRTIEELRQKQRERYHNKKNKNNEE